MPLSFPHDVYQFELGDRFKIFPTINISLPPEREQANAKSINTSVS